MTTTIAERYFHQAQELKKEKRRKNKLTEPQILIDLAAYAARGGEIHHCAIGETGDASLRAKLCVEAVKRRRKQTRAKRKDAQPVERY